MVAVAGSFNDMIQVDVKYFEAVETPEARRIKAVLTVICCYTGWVVVIPLFNEVAVDAGVGFMREWGYKHMLPNMLVCDNGDTLKGMMNYAQLEGVHIRNSSPFHSRSHGIVERCNQELGKICSRLAAMGQISWLDELPRAVAGMNCSMVGCPMSWCTALSLNCLIGTNEQIRNVLRKPNWVPPTPCRCTTKPSIVGCLWSTT